MYNNVAHHEQYCLFSSCHCWQLQLPGLLPWSLRRPPPPGLLTPDYLPIKEADWLLNPTKSHGSPETLSARGVRAGKLSDPGAAEPNEPKRRVGGVGGRRGLGKGGGGGWDGGVHAHHLVIYRIISPALCKLLAAASRLTCRRPGHAGLQPFCFLLLALPTTVTSPHCRQDFTEIFATPAVASDKRRR